MLLAPAWSIVAVTLGTMPIAWATLVLKRLTKLEVGYLVRTASISFFSMPQSSIALRIASTVRLTAERPGVRPYWVLPTPTMQYLSLSDAIAALPPAGGRAAGRRRPDARHARPVDGTCQGPIQGAGALDHRRAQAGL